MEKSRRENLVPIVHARAGLLAQLDEDRVDRRDLHHRLEDSRSTVYRALDELEECQLASQVNGRYQATRFGQLINQEYRRFSQAIDALFTLNQTVDTLPPPDRFDPIVLVDATIVPATKHAPAGPLAELELLFAGATRVQCLSPVWSWPILGIIEALLADGVHITLLTGRAHSGPALDEILAYDHCTQQVVESPPPFLLALAERPDPAVGVVLFDDVGRPEAMIRNDTRAAIDWAETVIERCLHDH